ncbi:DUF1310 family protein [Streptococcus acidominimus]|uniref:DUF1310 family protein n=1 Tax=Streptococcus acidominimus TaxID=1326 RepID=A0A4Y9FKM9_STRAI|nr:DUF1310 family protein [Streptococcus acidominimus]MBF0819820.1 DUF1310 family protein [Streptococcus acidominimus]MBF0838889.1 DUF1310 family protein [Streptococcus acidominimus]MBF0847631.1 DUF1310 family protein [Streptococcus danieliae]TFU29402.1 DUF1310 family protein [Streptococcus acidominimus]
MKSWQKWLLGFIVSAGVIIGIGVLEQMNKQEQLKQEMIKVVESEEVKQIIEQRLTNLDTKALTDQGIIRSYRIDGSSITNNPMGGIRFTVFINEDTELYLRFTLHKTKDEKYHFSGGYSAKLDELLKGD